MHMYPEHHVIYGDYALEQWDPDLTQKLLDLMVPNNMRLDIVSKSFVADNGKSTCFRYKLYIAL